MVDERDVSVAEVAVAGLGNCGNEVRVDQRAEGRGGERRVELDLWLKWNSLS